MEYILAGIGILITLGFATLVIWLIIMCFWIGASIVGALCIGLLRVVCIPFQLLRLAVELKWKGTAYLPQIVLGVPVLCVTVIVIWATFQI